jgi:hypothetical protein
VKVWIFIELGLFTCDEMTSAFEFNGMEVRYDVEGLMGRGLYVGKHNSEIHSGFGSAMSASGWSNSAHAVNQPPSGTRHL